MINITQNFLNQNICEICKIVINENHYMAMVDKNGTKYFYHYKCVKEIELNDR